MALRQSSRVWLAAGSIALIALLLYAPFRSISLDDFDSFNFVRALVEFSPAKFQPHPPGYIFYVWLGKAMLALTGDSRTALTGLSVLCAASACAVLFVTGRELFNARVGLYAVLLVMGTPLLWLNADKALSDAPGLLAHALCGLLLALAARGRVPLWTVAAACGIAAGFRPQNTLGLLAAMVLLGAVSHARWGVWLGCGLALAVSLSAWLVPTAARFDWDFTALINYQIDGFRSVRDSDSLFDVAVTPASLWTRVQAVWWWTSRAIFGPLDGWPRAGLGLTGAVLAALAILRTRRMGIWLCLTWFLTQALLHLIFLKPSNTRYGLALLLPAALLVAAGLEAFPVPSRARLPGALGFLALTAIVSLPLAYTLHTTPAPPVQLAAYLAERFSPADTMVIAGESYNALGYHLPGWDVRFADYYGDRILEEIAAHKPAYLVIADPEAVRPDEQYVELETLIFTRDPNVHSKHARITADVYGRMNALTAGDFALPPDGIIHIGTQQDGKYLLAGWYRRENIGGVSARWTGDEPTAEMRVLLPAGDASLKMRALSFMPAQTLEVLCDGALIGSSTVPPAWTDLVFSLPLACARQGSPSLLTLRPSARGAPADAGVSSDQRTLAVAISTIEIAGR